MTVQDTSTVATLHTLLESGELWDECDGQWKATGIGLTYRKKCDGQLYYAWSAMTFRDYQKPGDIPVNGIEKEVLIPTEAYCPLFKSSYTQVPVVTNETFVKTHSLNGYDWLDDNQDKSSICEDIVKELEFCEQIQKSAHPNLAEYLGCEVKEGRVSGLCFRKYGQTLQELSDPARHGKRGNFSGWSEERIDQCLDPIESATRHLHSLGIVHNDINPSNIMFDQEGKPVLIDYGSCCKIGQSLEGIGRTYEWHDEKVNESLPSNDLDALEEIREWLSTKDSKLFRF